MKTLVTEGRLEEELAAERESKKPHLWQDAMNWKNRLINYDDPPYITDPESHTIWDRSADYENLLNKLNNSHVYPRIKQQNRYIKQDHALKCSIGSTAKYHSLMSSIFPAFQELRKNKQIFRTFEHRMPIISLNPTYTISIYIGKTRDNDRQMFLKLFNSRDRWKTEFKVTKELEQVGVPVITPHAVVLKDEIPNNGTFDRLMESTSYNAETLSIPNTITSIDNRPYRYAITSNFIESSTLREIIQYEWIYLDKDAFYHPHKCKELPQKKYDKVLKELKRVNKSLHKLHGVKNVQGAEERDYNFYYNQLILALENRASSILCDKIHKIANAYNQLKIGEELNKYKQNYKTVTHGDLHLDNILVTWTRPEEIRIIDTECAGIGLPQEDLATILTESYFNPEKETIEEKTTREKTEREYLKDYLSNIPETQHESYMAATALCGLSRETAMIAHKMIDYEKAPEENKQHVKDSWNRHLRAFDKFANMTIKYRPDMKEKIKDYAIEVKRLAA